MPFTLLRKGYNQNLTRGTFTGTAALGNATLEFLNTNSSDIPDIGDTLHTPLHYCGSTVGQIEYAYIRVKDVKKTPYSYDHNGDVNEFKYTVNYSSDGNEPSKVTSFSSDLQVVTLDNPRKWRYASSIDASSSGQIPDTYANIEGSIDRRISKVVAQGEIILRKLVHPTQLNEFFTDYSAIAGKINTNPLDVIGNSFAAITMKIGQVLCRSMSGGEERTDGSYNFDVRFNWRKINQKDGNGDLIEEDDWNYVLYPEADDGAAWMVPIKTTGTSGTILATDSPFIYDYAAPTTANSDEMNDFWTHDYSVTYP